MFTRRFIYSIVLVCALYGIRLAEGSVPHENFPSFDSMFTMPKTRSMDTVSISAAQPTLSSTNTAGLVYLEFYANSTCGGPVTFSSGFRADYCLPANDYIRPPFSDEDDYYHSFPFQSMKLSNVTESCDSWFITYYTDKLCTTVYSTFKEPANFTDCRLWTNQPVSNLVSAKGKCSLSSRAPVQATSYLVSDFTGRNGCTEAELVSYTAYSTDTCFGNGNFSSTLFTGNTTTNTIQETQFYRSTNCTRSANPSDQTDFTISADTCNAVQTPGYPVEDDAVAYTEFIGLDLVVYPYVPTAVPSARPSVTPSQLPTATPTHPPTAMPSRLPTAAPSKDDYVLFSAQQVISGIDLATYNTNRTLYSMTLRESIAACMNAVQANNIIDLVVTATTSSRAASFSLRSGVSADAATPAINAAYEVSIHNPTVTYESLSQQLITSVSIGTFTTILQSFAQESGAMGFATAQSTSVNTQDLLSSDDDGGSKKKGLGAGPIAGIVIGGVALLALLYWYKVRADKRNADILQEEAAAAAAAANGGTGAGIEAATVANPISAPK